MSLILENYLTNYQNQQKQYKKIFFLILLFSTTRRSQIFKRSRNTIERNNSIYAPRTPHTPGIKRSAKTVYNPRSAPLNGAVDWLIHPRALTLIFPPPGGGIVGRAAQRSLYRRFLQVSDFRFVIIVAANEFHRELMYTSARNNNNNNYNNNKTCALSVRVYIYVYLYRIKDRTLDMKQKPGGRERGGDAGKKRSLSFGLLLLLLLNLEAKGKYLFSLRF